MEAVIPLLCLLVFAALSWLPARRHLSRRPVVWTWRMVGVVSLGVLGAVAIPVLVAAVILNR